MDIRRGEKEPVVSLTGAPAEVSGALSMVQAIMKSSVVRYRGHVLLPPHFVPSSLNTWFVSDCELITEQSASNVSEW